MREIIGSKWKGVQKCNLWEEDEEGTDSISIWEDSKLTLQNSQNKQNNLSVSTHVYWPTSCNLQLLQVDTVKIENRESRITTYSNWSFINFEYNNILEWIPHPYK